MLDPHTEMVVVMSSAQVGKTELLLNTVGYFVDFEPSPMLLLQPTIQMAEAFSKDRLAPMVRDTPKLTAKIADSKSRSSGNTILHKSFPGGHITMAGANSPASLASRPVRVLLADEVDRFPASAGAEGDPFNLARKRTTTFWNRKILAVSTPTVRGASRIEALYEESTRERYHLHCPHCDELQAMWLRNLDYDTAQMACESCGGMAKKHEWQARPGVWVAENPGCKTRGFHLNELVSPWVAWESIIEAHRVAKSNPELLKTFVNTSLGETWEEEGERIDHSHLYARREHYPADVPQGACVLTAAVDVQDDRLEIGVEAWGSQNENWKIDFKVLRGNPANAELWQRLDQELQSRYLHESGHELSIACTTIDSGGHFTEQVYQFCKPRESRRIYPLVGRAGEGRPLVNRPSRSNKGKALLFTAGVDTAKELIFARLQVSEPGPGYIHFPVGDLFDPEYFEQLTAEKRVRKYSRGFPKMVWEKTRNRNEALDVAVYNLVALSILNPNFEKLAERLQPQEQQAELSHTQQLVQERKRAKHRRQNKGFVNSWR